MPEPAQNRVFNHVGLSVPDIQAAVDWYRKLLGFQQIGEVRHIKRSERPNDIVFDIYPSSLNEMKIAFLTTGNAVGFELFEFVHPKTYVSEQAFEYQRGGVFHFCVTDADPVALRDRIVQEGGKPLGQKVDLPENVTAVFAFDTWRNVIEILDASYERTVTAYGPS